MIGMEAWIARGKTEKMLHNLKYGLLNLLLTFIYMSQATDCDISIALTTCPDADSAHQIATILVQERLAACVNQIAGVRSTYIWNGVLQDEQEVMLIIKTTTAQLATVESRVKALHSYEVPEFIAIPVCAGSQSYLEWVRQNVGGLK
jgi:periplasmic divalent cation tolerance protein